MSREISTSFEVVHQTEIGARTGVLRFGPEGRSQLATPCFFPAMCVMTGPPGFGRQGANYKYMKRWMTREWRHPQFLTEILHFTDYTSSRKNLDLWLEHTFQEWADRLMMGGDLEDENGEKVFEQGAPKIGLEGDFDYENEKSLPFYDLCFFLDSGGFKLLSNSDFNLDKFDLETSPETIFMLQKQFGGDVIASLDQPIPPFDYSASALVDIQETSIRNAEWLYRKVSEENASGSNYEPLVYLAIHGIDHESTCRYVERLLTRIESIQPSYESIGFAIGSLVPRRANRALVTTIVKAATDTLRNFLGGKYAKCPVHAFGMGGDLIPILAMLGVDTFDNNTYVQAGANLRFQSIFDSTSLGGGKPIGIRELSDGILDDCSCKACSRTLEHDLLGAYKKVVDQERDKRHLFDELNRTIIKSEAYSFLSMHNLYQEFRSVANVVESIEKDTIQNYCLEFANHRSTKSNLYRALEVASGELLEQREKGRRVDLTLTRDSFAVPSSYKPPSEKELLLFLSCTKDKPYKSSISRKTILSAFNHDIRVHVVTMSGFYGPVPDEFEEEGEILGYDYELKTSAIEQCDFVASRLIDYLDRYGSSYRKVFAFVTTKAYRKVIEEVLKFSDNSTLLPASPRERTSKELLRKENLLELQYEMSQVLQTNFVSYQSEFLIDV
jgi:7-cyano-7-deazaguanine tRNA-ribosyltransferase